MEVTIDQFEAWAIDRLKGELLQIDFPERIGLIPPLTPACQQYSPKSSLGSRTTVPLGILRTVC